MNGVVLPRLPPPPPVPLPALQLSASMPSFPTFSPTPRTPYPHQMQLSPRTTSPFPTPRSPFPHPMLTPRAISVSSSHPMLTPRAIVASSSQSALAIGTPNPHAIIMTPGMGLPLQRPPLYAMAPGPATVRASSRPPVRLYASDVRHLNRLVEILQKAKLQKIRDSFESLWRSRWLWQNLRSPVTLASTLDAQIASTLDAQIVTASSQTAEADLLLRVLLGLRILQRFLLRFGLAKLFHQSRHDLSTISAKSDFFRCALPDSHYLVRRAVRANEMAANFGGSSGSSTPPVKPSSMSARFAELRGINLPVSQLLMRPDDVSAETEAKFIVSSGNSAPSNTPSPTHAFFSPPLGQRQKCLQIESRDKTTRASSSARLPHAPSQLPRRAPGEQRQDARPHEHNHVGTSSMPVPSVPPTSFRPSVSAKGPVPVRSEVDRVETDNQVNGTRASHAKAPPAAPNDPRGRGITIVSLPFSENSSAPSDSEGEWWDATQDTRASMASGHRSRLRLGTTFHNKLSQTDVENRKTLAAKALGVSKDASRDTIKKAFHESAKVYHPDKGGDGDDFKLVNVAYSKLKNDVAG